MHMIRSERRQEEKEMDLITIINMTEEEDTTSQQRVRSMKIAREFVHAILLEIVSSPTFPLDTTTTTCCTTLENNDVCKETFILLKFVGFVRRSKSRRDLYDMHDHLIPLIKELVSQLTLENVRSTLHSISIDLFSRRHEWGKDHISIFVCCFVTGGNHRGETFDWRACRSNHSLAW